MEEIIITIDGPAGVGKTTVAKILAQRLGFTYVDTGAMYRAVALMSLEKGISVDNVKLLGEEAQKLKLHFKQDGDNIRIFLEERDITNLIRTPEIDMLASTVSKVKEVREALWHLQKDLAQRLKRAIFEGRDMGTVVFPEAPIKFFLTASAEVRAERRWKQLRAAGKEVEYQEIYEALLKRDKQDSERQIAPLRPAPDAIIIDTTHLDIEEVVNRMQTYIANKLGTSPRGSITPLGKVA